MTFPKYLGDSKMFEYDKHYRDCQQFDKPFIKAKINPHHGNYFVQIDLMPCNYKFSKKDEEKLDLLKDYPDHITFPKKIKEFMSRMK